MSRMEKVRELRGEIEDYRQVVWRLNAKREYAAAYRGRLHVAKKLGEMNHLLDQIHFPAKKQG